MGMCPSTDMEIYFSVDIHGAFTLSSSDSGPLVLATMKLVLIKIQ